MIIANIFMYFLLVLSLSIYIYITQSRMSAHTHTHTHMLCLHFCSFFVFLADEIFLATLSCSLLLSLRNVP
uniref:Macaca fascicularis brain cDNA, clone: QbsA-10488 n=1 Tax=Macaca fascicularis TaxID=9541 RepID=I7GHP4_MACFA|nr:unnamed protein product [Macaca fascicularis]